jgi:hypothetical protein
MKRTILLATLCGLIQAAYCQCPTGNQTTYGTNNVWRGHIYDNADLTTYRGYVTEGNAGSPNFDESFGGDNVSYNTNSCTITTETFSARYRLTKSFSNGTYEFIVGGDDGYRLSLDGGSTWVINQWSDHSYQTTSYTVSLNGTYNMVLEYYENAGGNRISFSVGPGCSGTGSTTTYGTGNVWRGYVYDGTNFNTYKGRISTGAAGSADFITDFGGSSTTFSTSTCNVQTETFSVRFRLTKNFPAGQHTFIVAGDDGYRLSLDGGSTWVIDQWNDHSYLASTYTAVFSGNRSIVLEYYENTGDNTISMAIQLNTPLPVKLLTFSGKEKNRKAELNWTITPDSDPDHFDVEKSVDGINFTGIATIPAATGQNNGSSVAFQYNDASLLNGKYYYRLKMVDVSGVTTYSRVVLITNAAVTKDITVFPTVVTDGIVYLKTGTALFQATSDVVDMNGRLLNSHLLGQLSAGQAVSLQLPALSKGIYIVRVKDSRGFIASQKIIIQ